MIHRGIRAKTLANTTEQQLFYFPAADLTPQCGPQVEQQTEHQVESRCGPVTVQAWIMSAGTRPAGGGEVSVWSSSYPDLDQGVFLSQTRRYSVLRVFWVPNRAQEPGAGKNWFDRWMWTRTKSGPEESLNCTGLIADNILVTLICFPF